MSEKFEYFAIRNAPGSSTRRRSTSTGSTGRTRRRSSPASWPATSGPAPSATRQYTAWLDDRGFVVEDGVIFRHGAGRVPADRAEPNLAYFEELVGRPRRRRSRTSATTAASWPSRARAPATSSRRSRPRIADLPYFGLRERRDRRVAGHRLADRLHRRPRLRDLGPGRRRARRLGRGLGGVGRARASSRSG